jgi:cation diffusion facilitator CzcD-associated flavoprotein CzcO
VVIDTHYLVVGAGAIGLAFADTLVAETDTEVTVIDRRPAAGGHWLHAYPFVRLQTPPACYGVDSLALGEDRIDVAGENGGYYERATGGEVCTYFAEAVSALSSHADEPSVQAALGRYLTCLEPAEERLLELDGRPATSDVPAPVPLLESKASIQ